MKSFGLMIAMLLALAALGLSACGGDDDDETAATNGTTTTEAEGGGESPGGGEKAGGTEKAGGEKGGGGQKKDGRAGGEKAGGGGGETIRVSADPNGQLAFEQQSLNASAGSVSFDFENSASMAHDFCLEGGPGDRDLGCTDTITDDSSTLKVNLKPGRYTFYCSVGGHRQAGMEGTLTVK
jgi:plastocyanin